LYSVKADILGELSGREDVAVLSVPFREGAEAFEDIFQELKRQ